MLLFLVRLQRSTGRSLGVPTTSLPRYSRARSPSAICLGLFSPKVPRGLAASNTVGQWPVASGQLSASVAPLPLPILIIQASCLHHCRRWSRRRPSAGFPASGLRSSASDKHYSVYTYHLVPLTRLPPYSLLAPQESIADSPISQLLTFRHP